MSDYSKYMSDKEFKRLMKIFTAHPDNKELVRELADRMEVSQSTVKRWANGVSKPHPFIREPILKHIEELVWE